jgi:hypothetical protein
MSDEQVASAVDLPATLTAFGAPPRRATVTVVAPSPGQRLKRALRPLGVCWAIAGGAVFLPILHFILVPTFFLSGLAIGLTRLRDRRTVARVRAACPRCGLEQDFASGHRFAQAWSLSCPACHSHLELAMETPQS